MKVGKVCSPVFGATPIRKKSDFDFVVKNDKNSFDCQCRLASYPAKVVLCQMPQVSFAGNSVHSVNNKSKYNKFDDSKSSELELIKYNISKDVQRHIENEDYLSAIKGKLELADICRAQSKKEDTFYLEESIRRLYSELPKYQKNQAKDAIQDYNYEMALYIDDDIAAKEFDEF